jgi:hypothetical protein
MSATAYFNNPDLSVNFSLKEEIHFPGYESLFQSVQAFDEQGHWPM